MTPVVGLLIVMIVKQVGAMLMNGNVDKTLYIPFPVVFSLDYKTLAGNLGFFNVTTCDIWYMYEFEKNVPLSEREFFGYNNGAPINRPDSAGMLDANTNNVLNFPCGDINKTVPYF